MKIQELINEDAIDDFKARGGTIQQLPYKKPRTKDKANWGSKHIGTGKGGKAANMSGKGANTRVGTKPVVSTEDHEIQMADSELKSIYHNSRKLLKLIQHYSEQDGLEAWQQSKITKAADYLNSVLQAVSGQQTR